MDKLLYLDFTPDVRARERPRTWGGVAVTIVCALAVAGFSGWFLALYFTEASTSFVSIATLGKTYAVEFRCVSVGGCNVTYEYTRDGVCGHLAGRPGLNVSEGVDFTVDVCRARDVLEGVRVRTTFDANVQWYERNKLWVVELWTQDALVPFGEVMGTKTQFQRLRNMAIVDRTSGRERVVDSYWSVDATNTVLIDMGCLAAAPPFPLYCGSVQFTLSNLFTEEVKQRSNSLRAEVLAPAMAMLSGATILLGLFARLNVCSRRRGRCPGDICEVGVAESGVELAAEPWKQ